MKRQGLEDEDLSDKMRLDKLLALLGEGTRSEIKAMVRAGRVTVDGAGARDAGMQVDGAQSDVRLDGRRLCCHSKRNHLHERGLHRRYPPCLDTGGGHYGSDRQHDYRRFCHHRHSLGAI